MNLISLKTLGIAAMGDAALGLVATAPAAAKVEGDTIVFGAAISLTGKYTTPGNHTKRGYELAIKRINAMGGVTVGGPMRPWPDISSRYCLVS